jgi:membrane protease YdiL (CAAX protease family)
VSINGVSQWLRLLLGLIVVFGLFQWSAVALASDRGQAGLLVATLVVAATIGVERILFGRRVVFAAGVLGLGVPRAKGLVVTGGVAFILFFVVVVFAKTTGASLGFFPGWDSLVVGLFAQGGVAEETLFRGYLFGHLRPGRSFLRAATVSMFPFIAVHLLLFFTMPWPLALAAVLLSVVLSFPLAHLFELGGSTIWAPALLHFVIQGTVKVVVVSNGGGSFPLVWMTASALVPLLVFFVERPTSTRPSPGRPA